MPRENYCRCCGENKGHNFETCKNLTAMRKIILTQDGETRGWIERAKVAEVKADQVDELIAARDFIARIVLVLTEALEAKRSK